MYDPWGIGEALQHGMRMFSHGKRATGRSTLLINSVQNMDTIVFAQRAEAQRIDRLLKQSGKDNVYLITHDPHGGLGRAFDYITERYNGRGVLHFDHSWFEAIHLYELRGTMSAMDRFHQDMEQRRKRAAEDEERYRAIRPIMKPDDFGDYDV